MTPQQLEKGAKGMLAAQKTRKAVNQIRLSKV